MGSQLIESQVLSIVSPGEYGLEQGGIQGQE